jgi:hypothetical protein
MRLHHPQFLHFAHPRPQSKQKKICRHKQRTTQTRRYQRRRWRRLIPRLIETGYVWYVESRFHVEKRVWRKRFQEHGLENDWENVARVKVWANEE